MGLVRFVLVLGPVAWLAGWFRGSALEQYTHAHTRTLENAPLREQINRLVARRCAFCVRRVSPIVRNTHLLCDKMRRTHTHTQQHRLDQPKDNYPTLRVFFLLDFVCLCVT